MQISRLPLRAVTGAFILNSGISKLKAGQETAEGVHGFATTAYPQFKRLRPEQFTKLLGASEVALGAALLAPIVPPALAGAGLTAFSGGLLGLYMKVPGMRQEGSLKPTQEGNAIAKDAWLLGIGLSLLLAGLAERRQS
jgi:DoxX